MNKWMRNVIAARIVCRTAGWVLLAGWMAGIAGAAAGKEKTAEADGKTRKLLTGRYPETFLREKMLPREAWKPFPPASDRQGWEKLQEHPLNRERRAYLIGSAEMLVGKPWPALPATLYMEFARIGNRENFEDLYFERRMNLSILVLAECMEHRGRFLDEIANGIWAVCEETNWCVSAHASRLKGDVLHEPGVESLDLFACETGMTLSLTHYLLREELDRVSPALCLRIRQEVKRRILDTYASGDDFRRNTWLDGHNNWSPWCASNILCAALLLEEDPARLTSMTFRLMQVVDRFIDRYGEDGGCNEGPGYWNEAGGAMLVFLEFLRSKTNGAIDIYDVPKIAAMGRYIVYAHLDGPWFANFADADAFARIHPGKVYRFGERVGDETMKNLALLSMRHWRADDPVDPLLRIEGFRRMVLGPLMEMFWIPPEAKPTEMPRETAAWLPDLQVLYARESPRSGEGLALAAKGGHNAESHNHNDVGHFMLYLDGQPGIIDIGRETYTGQTFSDRRYDLWFTRGLGHNAPVVNGFEQQPGAERRATQVVFQKDDSRLSLSMNIEEAYPKEAGIVSLRRTFEFKRGAGASLRVQDAFECKQGPVSILISMYAAPEVKQAGPGRLEIACSPRPLLLEYEPEKMTVAIERVLIQDDKLAKSWGECVYRLAFRLETPEKSGGYVFFFHAAGP